MSEPDEDPLGESRDEPAEKLPIDCGWLVPADLDRDAHEAVRSARDQVLTFLAERFSGFGWSMPIVSYAVGRSSDPEDPISLLQNGAREREVRGWDFAFVVTQRDLNSYYKSYAMAVPSRALGAAALSIARLADTSRALLAERVATLALHRFGDLAGLWHRDSDDALMQAPASVEDLDRARDFSPGEREDLAVALAEVADLRLEETEDPPSPVLFYLRAAWERSGEIGSAIAQAHPWEFPLRFSRLSAAALSALFVLLITGEVWDLATSQRPLTIASLTLTTLGLTTGFILVRQRLILRRSRTRLSEQAVVMNVSAILVVLLGMLTTYACLFGLTLLLGWGLFEPEIVMRWAPAVTAPASARPMLLLAGLISSFGLLIGSLGASFEGGNYFRHVIYADEET